MTAAELKIVTLVKRLFARRVNVFIGRRGPKTAAWAKPEVYVYLSSFTDFGGVTLDGGRVARRPARGRRTLKGYVEERPGRIVLGIEVCVADYRHAQAIREMMLAPLMVHLESIRELEVSKTEDGSTVLVFGEILPTLHRFDIVVEHDGDSPLYCGQLEFHLDGFLHLQVMKRGGFKKSPPAKAPAKKVVKKLASDRGPRRR